VDDVTRRLRTGEDVRRTALDATFSHTTAAYVTRR